MPQLVNATPERIANHFVNNLFEQNSDSLHIRRVAFWVGLIVLGIEKVASARYVPGARQLRFDYNNQTYKATFKSKSDLMVLDPSSEFFQYLKQSAAAKAVPHSGAR